MYIPKLERDYNKDYVIGMYEEVVVAHIIYLYLTTEKDHREIESQVLKFDYKGYRVLDILKFYGFNSYHKNLFKSKTYNEICLLINKKSEENPEFIQIRDLLTKFEERMFKTNEPFNHDTIELLSTEKLILTNYDELSIENKKAYFNIISKVRNQNVQQKFRENLLKEFNSKCALCNIDEKELLIASHIIPYYMTNEDLEIAGDSNNGLLLCPLHDYLFESGRYITFYDNGAIKISDKLRKKDLNEYKLTRELKLSEIYLTDKRRSHMITHRKLFDYENR